MLINYGSCIVCLNSTPKELCTIIVNAVPNDAEIELIATGYTQYGNRITVPKNTIVECIVWKDGYVPYHAEIQAISTTQEVNITLQEGIRVNINATPSDAMLSFIVEGMQFIDVPYMYVPANTPFTYKVEKEDYWPYTETNPGISEETTFTVELRKASRLDVEDYTYTSDDDNNIILTEYIGTKTDVIAPEIEE